VRVVSDTMETKPLMFYYFGAKHRVAPKYQPPRHDLIVEPFAGSAAYSCYWLERSTKATALLIEKDARVVELWTRILSTPPEVIAEWPTPVVGERTTDLMVALHGGAAALKFGTSNHVVTTRMKRFYPPMRRRIARWVSLFGERITVVEGEYQEAPDVEATWFIDPPYQHQGHQYGYGSDGIDYQSLARWSQSRQGQVIVCEAYPADWLPFRPFYSHRSTANTYNTELVWESHPEPTLFDMKGGT